MGNSIIVKDMEYCYVCGKAGPEWHHVVFGPNRELSDYYGLIIPLCYKHHRANKTGVHGGNKALDDNLKRMAQEAFERTYPELNFREIFGTNYKEEANE